jgi:phosphatidylserine decarboxylase
MTTQKTESSIKNIAEILYDYAPRPEIAREGLAWVLGSTGLAVAVGRLAGKLKFLKLLRNALIAGSALLAYFYRDPSRNPLGNDPDYLYAPADGNLSSYAEVHEPLFIKGNSHSFKITGSLFDVHMLRVPKSGQLRYTFLDKNTLYLGFVGNDNQKFLISVALKSGLPISDSKPLSLRVETGEKVELGQRLGFSAFGKATVVSLYLEAKPDFAPLVQKNQKIRAGTTLLGRVHWSK